MSIFSDCGTLNAPYAEMRVRWKEKDCTPAWSLSALLELLPESIRGENGKYWLVVCHRYGDWTVEYNTENCDANIYFTITPDLIEACMTMIEWLTKHGYKLNENKE